MKVNLERCNGCKRCILYCMMGAIEVSNKKAQIDQDLCVECGTCLRNADCPTNALYMSTLAWPRVIRQYFSDPTVPMPPQLRHSMGSGRGTEEMKTNDRTGRYKKGEVGFCIELGRPGVGTYFSDVEKVLKAVVSCGAKIVKDSPLTGLICNTETGELKEEVKNERVLSCIIELRADISKVREIIGALKSVEDDVKTVFSVGLISRVSEDYSIPVLSILKEIGIPCRPNAKINVGLGRPLSVE